MNSAGMVLGVEGRGTATPQQYTNYRLNVPAGTTQIGITGRNSAEIAVKKLAVVETATVLASIDSLDVRVQTIEDSLVYDFIKQDVTITSGAYINRADGSVVANAAFDCAIFNYTAGDRWKVTARVNGSGVSLAVYMNSAGMVIGTEGERHYRIGGLHRLRADTTFRHRKDWDHHPYSSAHYCQKNMLLFPVVARSVRGLEKSSM
ncbi:hypothetical protein LOF14_27630 [Klebsiella variicola subsp. variicola]|nr:hypothetical protein LOF14_27630 [Klebsiella variicola subsp. variicola]